MREKIKDILNRVQNHHFSVESSTNRIMQLISDSKQDTVSIQQTYAKSVTENDDFDGMMFRHWKDETTKDDGQIMHFKD